MALRVLFNNFSTYFQPMKKNSYKYVSYAGYSFFALALLAVCFWGYRWYRIGQEEKAQEVFSSCMREYERAEQDATLWPNAELMFRLGLEQNKSSSMAPYFLAYQAEALLNMGKMSEARVSMKKAVDALSSSSPVATLYATKYALMMMDADESDIQKQGLDDLQRIANDTVRADRDMALYYLGLYYWSQEDVDKARTVWSELLPLVTAEPASPWAQLAAQKIEQLAP